jgi:FMN reductase
MPLPRIVAISGNYARPSKTRALVEAVAAEVGRARRIDLRAYDLIDAGPGLGAAFRRDALTLPAARIVDEIEAADGLVVGTPVHNGGYGGLFKHLFDFVRPDALAGKPVVLTAAGGGARHALVVEHGLRPLFAAFEALTVPTAIYAGEADFSEGRPADPVVLRRIGDAAAQLAALVERPPARRPAPGASVGAA